MDENAPQPPEPLRLTGAEDSEGRPTYLVTNDETRDPEFWTEEDVRKNQRFNEFIAHAPKPFLTQTLIAINVALFLIMTLSGVVPDKPDGYIPWGADYGPLTTHGQYWRMFTSMFIHFGLAHVALNMFCLFGIGLFAERLFGRVRYAALYFLSGLGGSLASLYWHPATVAGGASGAIFGVYGGVIGFLFLQPGIVPRHRVLSIGKQTGIFLVLNLAYGLFSPEVNVAAHLGGVIGGILVGGAFTRAMLRKSPANRLQMSLATAIVYLAAVGVLIARVPTVDDFRSEIERVGTLDTASIKLYSDNLNKVRSRQMTPADFNTFVTDKLLPPWKAEQAKVEKLRLPANQKQIADRIVHYMNLRADGWSLMSQGLITNNLLQLRQGLQREVEAASLFSAPTPKKK